KDADGQPTGELQEPPAIALVKSVPAMSAPFDGSALGGFAADACNHGVTTATDPGNPYLFDDAALAEHREIIDDADFPLRLSLFHLGGGLGGGGDLAASSAQLAELMDTSSDKMHLGGVKLFLDGPIQGFTARLQEPGYLPDDRKGVWLSSPEEGHAAFLAYPSVGGNRPAHRSAAAPPERHRCTRRPLPRPASHRAAPRSHRTRAGRAPAPRPPSHPHPQPAVDPGPVPPDEGSGGVREHLLQPHLVLGRPASRHDPRTRPGEEDERGSHRSAQRCADLVALRHARHPARLARHGLLRRRASHIEWADPRCG